MRSLSLIPIYLLSSSFVLVTNYWFSEEKEPVHAEGNFKIAAPMKFRTEGVKGTHLKYRDADASLYYTQHLNKNNSLIYQLGYYHMTLDWKENPRFRGKNYDYGVASLGYLSTSINKWRWALAANVSINLKEFDLIKTGVGYAMVWGRYEFSQYKHVHIGFYGFSGVKTVYFLPIIGMDFPLSPKFHLSAVFPFDIAARYLFNSQWHACFALRAFGSPYRFPQRVSGGINGYENGIFEIYSTTGDLSLNYRPGSHFGITLSGGYSFGGWLLVKDSHNHHGKYYKYDGAPYGRASLDFSF